MPQTFGKTLQPAQIDALVKYLSDVTKGGLMAVRLRAPGLPRAGLFLVLGTLLCAGIILGARAAYGFPISARRRPDDPHAERHPACCRC